MVDSPQLFNAVAAEEDIVLRSWSDVNEKVEVRVAAAKLFANKAEYTFVEKYPPISHRRMAIEATRAKRNSKAKQ